MELRFVLGKNFRPCVLDVIEYIGNELYFGLFACRIRSGHLSAARADGRLHAEVGEKIAPENQAQSENHDSSTNPEAGSHSTARPSVLEI